ncbi:MAG: polysaccharide biosynthesis/export family protein [Bacteroidota bacterium]
MRLQKLLVLYLTLSLSSCVSHQELLNFTEGQDLPMTPEDITNLPQLRIQPDDLLSIRVQALDIEAVLPFNVDPPLANNVNVNGNIRPQLGYLVSREGTIEFPVLGEVNVLGMTTLELREYLEVELAPYLKEPVILVRYLNFRITVLGEVLNPSTFFVASERVTLLDALGRVGDLTPYANRTNVLIIREQNGQRQTTRLNLQDRNIFESPFFYLQQNDVIYVEPLPVRTAAIRDQSQRILPWFSAITALTTLVVTLTR